MTATVVPLDLTICGIGELNELFETRKFDAIISILDPSGNSGWFVKHNEKRAERLRRHCDTTLCMDFCDDDFVPYAAVVEIITFVRQLPPGARLLVHCAAGISRSTAAALIALREHGVDYEGALAEVLRVRDIAQPNAMMLLLYKRFVRNAEITNELNE